MNAHLARDMSGIEDNEAALAWFELDILLDRLEQPHNQLDTLKHYINALQREIEELKDHLGDMANYDRR